MRKFAIALSLLLASVAPALSAPFYIGAIEIDTEDAAAVRDVVNHCQDLSRTDEAPSALPLVVQNPLPIPLADRSLFRPIDADTLMSLGSDDGDQVDENDRRNSEFSTVDGLTSIGSEECQAAGLLP